MARDDSAERPQKFGMRGMRQHLDAEDLPPLEENREREFTLGTIGLVIVGCMLLAVCGLFFWLGYRVGSHSSSEAVAANLPSAATPLPGAAAASPSHSKPAAAPQPVPQQTADGSVAASTPADPDADIVKVPDASTSASTPAASQPVVRPAFPSQTPVQTTQTPAVNVPSAAAPAVVQQGIMVQIAAVSHTEDANVLVGALRRRGYAASVRRDLSDGLLHVQVGPFASRSDANVMKMKLLNDGYNAMIEP